MNEDENEKRLQQLADEFPHRSHHEDNGSADIYRAVYHHLARQEITAPEPGFAQRMESLLQDFSEQASLEKWMLRILLGSGAAGSALFIWKVLPGFGNSFGSSLLQNLAGAPWSLLAAAAVAMAGAWIADRWSLKKTTSA